MGTMIDEILEELTIELEVTEDSDIALLTSKIKGAIREVKLARKYKGKTDTYIEEDIQSYYSNIKNLAAYDFCLVGGEFQTSHSENGISRSFADRNDCFDGVLPIAEIN
ncbi:hypothetical protein C8E03_108186 [Lachnotalea glycerini]|uniref:Phage gp6-like head-tail connector protein n=1 Tax=Lachnotalea glycerini TaxID=1763509 RepID=A0A318EPN8_9FIRM|nr:hypothetical protein [Lachnotalea glycerini]PXV88459.1 hypothetical protein C8E03_108186 [Lachnotalea glycerini]